MKALLNCTGRAPNVTDCGLDNVGVEWDNLRGVQINDYFETTNPNIYSCGDCASPYKFTHAADFQVCIRKPLSMSVSHSVSQSVRYGEIDMAIFLYRILVISVSVEWCVGKPLSFSITSQ